MWNRWFDAPCRRDWYEKFWFACALVPVCGEWGSSYFLILLPFFLKHYLTTFFAYFPSCAFTRSDTINFRLFSQTSNPVFDLGTRTGGKISDCIIIFFAARLVRGPRWNHESCSSWAKWMGKNEAVLSLFLSNQLIFEWPPMNCRVTFTSCVRWPKAFLWSKSQPLAVGLYAGLCERPLPVTSSNSDILWISEEGLLW